MAPAPLVLYKAAADRVSAAGVPVRAIFGGVAGGLVQNPIAPEDQGLDAVEVLYVDLTGPATAYETATTTPLQPGQWFVVPPGQSGHVWVNAASAGHRFSAYVAQPPTPYPPTPTPGAFPPAGPTTVQATIPSYLYVQYRDDEDLQAFVDAFNALAQQYLDWLNQVPLPIYTDAQIAGALLDWVAAGLYGLVRPALSSGQNRDVGPLDTWAFNTIALNARRVVGPQDVVATTDDVFKRIITWNFWKGDGRKPGVRWLKRRIMRFLVGAGGLAPNVDQTYQISVTFGVGNQVNIRLLAFTRRLVGGAVPNWFAFNTQPFNGAQTVGEALAPIPNAATLAEAILSGAVQLPFQYEYTVRY